MQGPENDADAVVEWLTREGGLPPGNIKLIRSKDFSAPPDAAPSRDKIQEAFLWLDGLAAANAKGRNPRKVGTRLYLYVSGHGFSPRFRQGCLLAGDAAERQFSANVFPTAWIDWLQDAEYFREFVLWMDCCMDRSTMTQPTPPPLDPIGGGGAPGPTFIAFAAPRPLKAVEKPIPEDGGKWHGVFTWNLLQGLRGAAANSFGMVTGHSLADWLRQSQLSWLDEVDRRNPDIAKEPSIVDENDALVLARGLVQPEFDVMLRFPEAMVGNQAQIWSEAPPTPGQVTTIVAGGNAMRLRPGLHVVTVPGAGLRHGISITRPCEIVLSETGNAPVEATGMFRLSVDPNDATADIRLIGNGFSSIDTGAGTLESRLPFGLYQMRIRIGRQIVEKTILLDDDWPTNAAGPVAGVSNALPQLPEITSAVPLPDTRTTHEYHQEAAVNGQDRIDVTAGAGAELMVMARCFTAKGQVRATALPWNGVSVHDSSGKLVADLATAGEHDTEGDPAGVCTIALAPGAYELNYSVGDMQVAQSLILAPTPWRTEAYLLRTLDASPAGMLPRVSLIMRQRGSPWGTQEDMRLEKARVALADERPILSSELDNLLVLKVANPLAGIIGGHLLLIDHEQGGRNRLDLLNLVVRNLRVLVGPGHPDVEALSLACPDPSLRCSVPIVAAPLFERSWRMLVKGSQTNERLIPLSLWQRVHATLAVPPFLIWSTDQKTQEDVRKALVKAIFAPSAQPVTSEVSEAHEGLAQVADAAPAEISVPDTADAVSAVTHREAVASVGTLLTSTLSSASDFLRTTVRKATASLSLGHASTPPPPMPASAPAPTALPPPLVRADYVSHMSNATNRADALGLPRIALEVLAPESRSGNDTADE